MSARTAEKDYVDGPQRYAVSGTRELWVFDPERHGGEEVGGPILLQVWRRLRSGAFRRVYEGDGPAYSDELQAWLVVTSGGTRLRVAHDEAGGRLWLTTAEAADARAGAADARAEAERERAEAERVAKEAALEEIERLRAELRRRGG